MPITYHCDQCGVEGASLDGWFVVSVQFIVNAPNPADIPTPPGTRTLESTLPDFIFDTAVCRTAWCAKTGLQAPVVEPAP
jgi:hypothetical protein